MYPRSLPFLPFAVGNEKCWEELFQSHEILESLSSESWFFELFVSFWQLFLAVLLFPVLMKVSIPPKCSVFLWRVILLDPYGFKNNM